jgi:homospermidine synthase
MTLSSIYSAHIKEYIDNMNNTMKGRLEGHYQREGVRWMLTRELDLDVKRGIITDDMGFGKTIQSIALICANRDIKPTLIVTTVGTVGQWRGALINFGGLRPIIVNLSYKKILPDNIFVFITAYSSFQRPKGTGSTCYDAMNYPFIKKKKSLVFLMIRDSEVLRLPESQKIVFFGCGAVAKCCMHYLDRFFAFNYKQVTVIDKDPESFKFPTVQKAFERGARRLLYEIKRENINHLLDDTLGVKKYDIIIDLTTNTNTYKILKECRIRKLLYINTSIEDDNPLTFDNRCPTDNGIFLQHYNIQSIASKSSDSDNVTTVIEFGMNPGLISVFVKQGLIDMAKMVLKQQATLGNNHVDKQLLTYYKQKNHKKIAQLLKVRAIHCSEIDTQLPKVIPKSKFVNTWSCVGLITEGVEPAEIQIGSHEKYLPFHKDSINEVIPQLIVTKTPGADIKFRSIVPLRVGKNGVEFTYINGHCIHHGEGISLNRYLGSFEYSPTMHYVYKLNPITDKLMSLLSKKTLVSVANDKSAWKVLNMYDDDLTGYDNVGALFVLEEDPIRKGYRMPYCFWTGSILDDKYTKHVLMDDYFGPTIIQVMAGVLSGVRWMIRNRKKGLVFGEDIDNNYIIRHAKKYLGHYYSGPVTHGMTLPGTTLSELIVKGGSKKYRTSIGEL